MRVRGVASRTDGDAGRQTSSVVREIEDLEQPLMDLRTRLVSGCGRRLDRRPIGVAIEPQNLIRVVFGEGIVGEVDVRHDGEFPVLSSQFSVLSSWFSVPSSRFPVFSSCQFDLSSHRHSRPAPSLPLPLGEGPGGEGPFRVPRFALRVPRFAFAFHVPRSVMPPESPSSLPPSSCSPVAGTHR